METTLGAYGDAGRGVRIVPLTDNTLAAAQLFLFDCDEMGTGRWGGVDACVLEPLEAPLDFKRVGRLGDDRFGLIEEGGVLLLDKVSRVEVDLPAIMSPLDWPSGDELVRKLVFDRRRRSLKKGMVDIVTVTIPRRSQQGKTQ
jgi:hypothetical protein